MVGDYAALAAARDRLLAVASKRSVLQGVYVETLPRAPHVGMVLDREKANALGITFASINDTLSTSLGSACLWVAYERTVFQSSARGRHRSRGC